MKKFIALFILGLILAQSNYVKAQLKYISYANLYGDNYSSGIDANRIALKKALELAKILDQGYYRGELIRNTSVLNHNNREFFIVGTLAGGTSIRFYVDLLQRSSSQGLLKLKNNRYLIFPDQRKANYEVFNIQEFYNQAVRAKFYKKSYPLEHIFGGHDFFYEINSVKNQASERNKNYTINLVNGDSVNFGFKSAYNILKEGRLVNSVNDKTAPLYSVPFWVTKVIGLQKIPFLLPNDFEIDSRNVKKFGLQIVFEKPFDYRLQDIKVVITNNKGSFSLDVGIPNSFITKGLKSQNAKNLEYIKSVQVIQSRKDIFTLIKANLIDTNYGLIPFLDTMPLVYFTPDKKNIFIIFYQNVDQTIDYNKYAVSESFVQGRAIFQKQKLSRLSYLEGNPKMLSLYNEAVDYFNESLSIDNWQMLKEAFYIAMQKFTLAASYAKNEKELNLGLTGKDLAMDRLFNGILIGDIYPLIKNNYFSTDSRFIDYLNQLVRYSSKSASKNKFIEDLKTLYQVDKKLNLLVIAVNSFNISALNSADMQRFKAIANKSLNSIKSMQSGNQIIKEVKGRIQLELNVIKSKFR